MKLKPRDQSKKQIPKNCYSFCVGSRYGPRSAHWIVDSAGRDVYVSTDVWQHQWHISLHNSGACHVRQLSPDGRSKPTRVLDTTAKDPSLPYEIGLRIAIPDSCLRPAKYPDLTAEPQRWLDRPSEGGVIEVGVVRSRSAMFGDEQWPGEAVGMQGISLCRLIDDSFVWIVARALSGRHERAQMITAMAASATPQEPRVVLDSPERRGIVAFDSGTTGLYVIEWALD